ncbi:unnamed protein product [Bemisia tabaci]|uniref:SAM domain-containing protein n=2 Tax=Bemisia tabaci TaxID=7038 RepID=A0A9P0AM90_BEMTA|nr:unnamed protein product [Bemisia tabaci]
MADDIAFEPIFGKIDSMLQFGWTQYLIHVRDGHVARVQKMISEGYTPNDCNSYGLSSLTVSVISKNERMVETILNTESFTYDKLASELIDPVSLASLLGLQGIVLILLDKFPNLVNNKNTTCGYTPIFFAAIKRHYRIVQILIARGANLSIRNSANHTLLEVAMMMNDAELVAFLSAKSGVDDLRKPRCHPRLYTPPRCLKQVGVSPPSPAKPYSKPDKRKLASPVSTPKTRPLRQINNQNLPNRNITLQNNSFEPNDQFSDISFSDSSSFFSNDFVPLAKSSLAFRNSSSSNTPSFNFNNSSFCASPKLQSAMLSSPYSFQKMSCPSPRLPLPNCTYYHYSVSDVPTLTTSPATPNLSSPDCSYFHFSSPTPLQNHTLPHTPLTTPKNFLHPTKSFAPSHTPVSTPKFGQSLMVPQLLNTPQTHHRKFLHPQKLTFQQPRSFIASYVTPLRTRNKKVPLRTKLLDKLYRREKLIKNDENQNLAPICADDLKSVLEYLGLEKYYKLFELNQVEPEILSTFTDVDLETMGIEDKKTRKTILKKIRKGLLDANT